MVLLLFALGSNGNGQLGIGSDDDTALPCLVVTSNKKDSHDLFASDSTTTTTTTTLTPSQQQPFHDFAAGGNHTAVITHGRRMFMTGSNKDSESLLQEPSFIFQSHDMDPEEQHNLPERNHEDGQDKEKNTSTSKSLKRWRSVACGWAFTIAVTEPRPFSDQDRDQARQLHRDLLPRVYAWGSGSFGELGLGPGKSKTGHKAIQIPINKYHDHDHDLCNQDTVAGVSALLGATTIYEATKVRAGLRHVLLLMTDTAQVTTTIQNAQTTRRRTVLFGWGSNRQGQLGVLERKGGQEQPPPFTEKELRGKFMEPTRIRLPSKVRDDVELVDMACGQNHSLILFSDGSVYSSGLNKHRQLGPGSTAEQQPPPPPQEKTPEFRIGFERVQGLPFVDLISCGWNHNGAMDRRDRTRLYLWGRNDHGQLGNGATTSITDTDNATGIVIVRIPRTSVSSASNDISLDHEDKGLYEEIISFSCGSEHCLAMTRSGHCYAWGWNEHGNCGTSPEGIDDRKNVLLPRRIHSISDSTPSSSSSSSSSSASPRWVAGGYGSSWICTES